jgi:hypothetical protein
MGDQGVGRACPFCKEQIHPEATKCRFCGSRISPERPAHGGICPFCKEQINPEATRCRYCTSDLNDDGWADGSEDEVSYSYVGDFGTDFDFADEFGIITIKPIKVCYRVCRKGKDGVIRCKRICR